MLKHTRLRCAAALATATLWALAAGPVSAQTAETPGPEELAVLHAAAPAVSLSAYAAAASPAPGLRAPASAVGVGLPLEVLEAAGAYRLYMRQAAALSASFENGASVAEALKLGAAYEPRQLTRGAVAFAALAALHDTAFVQSVRALGVDPARRAALAAQLTASPQLAAALPGADAAAGRIVAALGGEGERVRTAGLRVKQAAYDVQRHTWAKSEVSARIERLAEAKALSAKPLAAPATELVELQLAALGAGRLNIAAGTPEPSERPVVARGLALAALAVLGEADASRAEPLMDEAACGSCLRMSKLNLFQCLAVAKPWYEDVFCLGQHVLMDTGDCIQSAAVTRRAPPAALPASLLTTGSAPGEPPTVQTSTVAALH